MALICPIFVAGWIVAVCTCSLSVTGKPGHVGIAGNDLHILPPTDGTVMVDEYDLIATISMQQSTIAEQSAEIERVTTELSVLNSLDASVQCRAQASGNFDAAMEILVSGANDWEHFEISGTHYLVVASNVDTKQQANSEVFRWDGTNFVSFQQIATRDPADWVHFVIGTAHYLAVANQRDASTKHTDSEVFKWSDDGIFESIQQIPTFGAFDWEHFVINGVHYIAVANYHNDVSFEIPSQVYKWNGGTFVSFQAIPTRGAHDLCHFEMDDTHYLAVANRFNGSTYEVDSEVLRWNGTMFVTFQLIPTKGAHDWQHFVIDDTHYLLVANQRNDEAMYTVDSVLYRWNGVEFDAIQHIPTSGASHWEHFTIHNEHQPTHFFAVANQYTGSSHLTDSEIFTWVGGKLASYQRKLQWVGSTLSLMTFTTLLLPTTLHHQTQISLHGMVDALSSKPLTFNDRDDIVVSTA
eukprot:m.121108 g.121108  ORF g.121108 m.121108 type:complete len:466 (-) comp13702_c0_seq1:114-1511(-)